MIGLLCLVASAAAIDVGGLREHPTHFSMSEADAAKVGAEEGSLISQVARGDGIAGKDWDLVKRVTIDCAALVPYTIIMVIPSKCREQGRTLLAFGLCVASRLSRRLSDRTAMLAVCRRLWQCRRRGTSSPSR